MKQREHKDGLNCLSLREPPCADGAGELAPATRRTVSTMMARKQHPENDCSSGSPKKKKTLNFIYGSCRIIGFTIVL